MDLVRLRARLPAQAGEYAAAVAARGLEVAGKFGLYALSARRLGLHESGLFFLCLSWVNIGSTAARMGLERPTVRQMAADLGIGRGVAARRTAMNSLAAVSAAGLVGAAVTWLLAAPAARLLFHEPAMAGLLEIAAVLIPVQTVTWASAYILIGLKRGVSAQMILSALPSTLALLALLAGIGRAGPLLWAYTLSFLLCGIAGLALIGRDWRGKFRDRPPPEGAEAAGAMAPMPPLRTEARPFLVVEMTQATVLSLPALLLGHFALPRDVSEFSIAFRLSNLVNTLILSIGIIASPRFAEHYQRGEIAQLREVERRARQLIWALALPVVAAMLLAPSMLLRLLGSEFGGARSVLVALALAQLLNCLLPFQDTLLAMTGHGSALRRWNTVQLALCVALGFALVPPFGMMGAAWAGAVALAAYVAGCAFAARRLVR